MAFLSAFLAYEPRQLVTLRETLSHAVAAVPPAALNPLAPMIEEFAPQAPRQPTVSEPVGAARIVRVAAIREAQNYGWIQLPRGAHVDLVEEQRDGFLIRYDESFLLIPRAAVEDGTVVLRSKRSRPTS